MHSAPTAERKFTFSAKAKLKKLFRQVGKTYHEGKRARALIDSLDMQKIIDTSSAPLAVIESILFELEFLSLKS